MTEHAHRYRSETRGRLQQVFEVTQPALHLTGEEAEAWSKEAGDLLGGQAGSHRAQQSPVCWEEAGDLPGVKQAATEPSHLQSAGREHPSALPACWAHSSALFLPF